MEFIPATYFVRDCIPNSCRGAMLRSSTEKPKSLTAKLARGAKERNSLTAKDAKAAKKSIIGTKP